MTENLCKNYDDKLGEECGVVGIYDTNGGDVAPEIYYSLLTLQHRGQESSGITVTDTAKGPNSITTIKEMGLTNEIFNEEKIASLKGNLGIGHVRYSTAGASTIENSQPFAITYLKGSLALAHNGNLVNAKKIRENLARTGAVFQSTTDTEMIVHLIARYRASEESVEKAISKAMKEIEGSYSLVVKSPRKLIGVRDPYGIRPLCLGKKDGTFYFASESCVLDTLKADFIRDVEPGEIVTITSRGEIISDRSNCIEKEKRAICIFEYIYFARPDSNIDGVSVYNARILAGKYLAKDSFVDADIVIGVPESGIAAAMGYSLESGIPYRNAFVKNTYVGRTFIKPKQKTRAESVQVKLNVLKEVVKDKKVILIDDSIVRGTTSNQIITMLKKAGAKEVHMRVSAPPFLWPCYFGTDIPNREQLVAYNRSLSEINEIINADSLQYLKLERLKDMVGHIGICDGCFTGKYVFAPPEDDIRGEYEE